MLRAIAVLLVVGLVALLPAAAAAGESADDFESWRPAVHSAAEYAAKRRGVIAFSVRTPGHRWGWHAERVYPMASLLKPMLTVAYLDRAGVRGRALTRADKALLSPMIRRSDNAAASRVLGIVGVSGLRRVARRAGMKRFTAVTPVWGLSRTTASDQSRFFLRIDSLLPPRHRAYAMKLLATIVPSQRWGIGQVRLPGWKLYFKGGWGSGTGWVDHQSALLVRGDERVAVSVMTQNDGSHAYGNETLRGVAKRLLGGLGAAVDRPSACPRPSC
jgi:hypothetical protein